MYAHPSHSSNCHCFCLFYRHFVTSMHLRSAVMADTIPTLAKESEPKIGNLPSLPLHTLQNLNRPLFRLSTVFHMHAGKINDNNRSQETAVMGGDNEKERKKSFWLFVVTFQDARRGRDAENRCFGEGFELHSGIGLFLACSLGGGLFTIGR